MIDPTCLLKGLEDAKASPERFDMSDYCFSSGVYYVRTDDINKCRDECGTIMCLAGWASKYAEPIGETRAYRDVIHTVVKVEDAHFYDAWGDLDQIFHGGSEFYPSDVHLDSLTIEQVESAVHQFIQKYNGAQS